MKVAIVCPRSPRLYYGGLENLTMKIAQQAAKQGADVEIFCTAGKAGEAFAGKVKVREFTGFSPGESYYFSLSLFNALGKSDADVVHCIAYNNLLALESLAAKRKGASYVLSINMGGEPPLFRRMLHKAYPFLINLFAKKIDKVICVTQRELGEYSKKLNVAREKFTVIQTGIDVEAIRKVKAGQKKDVIVSPGRFVKIKNFHRLIPAFAKVLERFPKMKLVLIGSGPMEAELREMVKSLGIGEKVVFEKPVPMDRMAEVHKKIKESRMVALLTDSGFEGIMGFEAIACGVPVLFADSRGTTESVKKGIAQAVRNPEDIEEIASKICGILENPEKFTPKNPGLLSWEEATLATYNVYKDVSNRNNKGKK